MHTLALFFRIDESANSFTNISLFVIHFLLVYTFQVTQEITNSLYIDIFNKISLNKTNKRSSRSSTMQFFPFYVRHNIYNFTESEVLYIYIYIYNKIK